MRTVIYDCIENFKVRSTWIDFSSNWGPKFILRSIHIYEKFIYESYFIYIKMFIYECYFIHEKFIY